MNRHRLSRLIVSCLPVLVVVAAACGGPDPEPPVDLSGRWSGATNTGISVTLSLSHDLSTNLLSGTWTMVSGGESFVGTIDGRLVSGSVFLAM